MTTVLPPLVSVVMPFLDPHEQYFREAVASVLTQDYRPLEIIFVDDGSRDSFADQIHSWCSIDNVPIQLLHHENRVNKGVSASRNLGIARSTGKYIAFLDSDDVWLPGKIRQQCNIMECDETISLTFGLTKYWLEWCGSNRGKKTDFTPTAGFRAQTVFEPPVFLIGMLRGTFIVPSASNMMARKASVLACNGFQEEFSGLYEDQVFVAKLALSEKVCAVPSLWDKYRQHPDSMMARADKYKDELAARRKFLRWLSAYCRRMDLQYPALAEVIAKALWLSNSSWTRTGSASYRLIRWAKKWLLRFEERAIPRRVRWKYWNRSV
jgi:glycosyltransferase involved in cell wall biosynthesis